MKDPLLSAERDRLLGKLETLQKEKHVQNLEWAISLAESDPLYAEVFRPYFQKIVDAVASNPATKPHVREHVFDDLDGDLTKYGETVVGARYVNGKWEPQCPYGDWCSRCDAIGYCERAESRPAREPQS